MRVEIHPDALAQIEVRQEWWTSNRPKAPMAFVDELASALDDLAEHATTPPVFVVRDGVEIRRWLLPRSRCHLYYAVDETGGVVHVLAAWGAKMGRIPSLAKTSR